MTEVIVALIGALGTIVGAIVGGLMQRNAQSLASRWAVIAGGIGGLLLGVLVGVVLAIVVPRTEPGIPDPVSVSLPFATSGVAPTNTPAPDQVLLEILNVIPIYAILTS